MGMATLLWDPIKYDMSLKLPSGGINDNIRSDCKARKVLEQKGLIPYCMKDNYYLPSFETNTWVEAGVIKHTGIHEGHAQIRHSRQLDHTVNLKAIVL
jgi:hypothetical protein